MNEKVLRAANKEWQKDGDRGKKVREMEGEQANVCGGGYMKMRQAALVQKGTVTDFP